MEVPEHKAVGVRAVVASHLGREATACRDPSGAASKMSTSTNADVLDGFQTPD
jgi:hypothetical protein